MSTQDIPNLSLGALFGLEGKVVVVTGGGTGLGLMMATAFVQNGAKTVYICSRKLKNLETAANTLNSIRSGVCVPLEANLTTAQGCKDLASKVAQREQKVDVLVNNSGVSWGSAIDNVDEVKGWDRVFDVNTKSIFYLTVALLPLLKKNVSIDRPASVINISCVAFSLGKKCAYILAYAAYSSQIHLWLATVRQYAHCAKGSGSLELPCL